MKQNIKKPFTIEEYFKSNRLINQYHCHNQYRKKLKLAKIHPIEYITYRDWASKNKAGTIQSNGRKSIIKLWEIYKKEHNLIFTKLTSRIKWTKYNKNTIFTKV